MPIKFIRIDPKPVPLPPPTYDITGLDAQEVRWLRKLVTAGNLSSDSLNDFETAFRRRILAVLPSDLV